MTDKNALDRQEGGSHYKHFEIQPIEFCERNKLTPCEANVVKYVCRHRFKNGKEDLLKIKHYVDIMLEMYYNDENDGQLNDRLLNLNENPPEPPAPPKARTIVEGVSIAD